MSRTFSPRLVIIADQCFSSIFPISNQRSSSVVRAGISTSAASAQSLRASPKSMPCLRLFSVLLSGSYSKTMACRCRSYSIVKVVQCGLDPKNRKPMTSVGTGVEEIRVRDAAGIFRMIYLATRPEGVYVLHCFQKKTRQTSRSDVELATKRFKAISKVKS